MKHGAGASAQPLQGAQSVAPASRLHPLKVRQKENLLAGPVQVLEAVMRNTKLCEFHAVGIGAHDL